MDWKTWLASVTSDASDAFEEMPSCENDQFYYVLIKKGGIQMKETQDFLKIRVGANFQPLALRHPPIIYFFNQMHAKDSVVLNKKK